MSKQIELNPQPVARMVEDIVGCKWSMVVLCLIRRGVIRPGAMKKSVDGLSKKVLNERLQKLVRFGIIDRTVFAEVPPRVEYRLNEFGEQFVRLIDAVEELESRFRPGVIRQRTAR
jgi:DNA-binding HxlR family transcriptional regulator